MDTTAAGTTPVQLGQAIRSARERRGISLRELARRVNVSPSFVSQVELGKANPSVGTLYTLVTVLGTTLEPEDMAPLVVFLAADESSKMTGQVLVNDAGSWIT